MRKSWIGVVGAVGLGLMGGCATMPDAPGPGSTVGYTSSFSVPGFGSITSTATATGQMVTISMTPEAAAAFPCSEVQFLNEQGDVTGSKPLGAVGEVVVPAGTAKANVTLKTCPDDKGTGSAAESQGGVPFGSRFETPVVKVRVMGGSMFLYGDGGDMVYDLAAKGSSEAEAEALARAYIQAPHMGIPKGVKVNGLVQFITDAPQPEFVAYFAEQPETWSVELNGELHGGIGYANTTVQRADWGGWIAVTALDVSELDPLDQGNHVRFSMSSGAGDPTVLEYELAVWE